MQEDLFLQTIQLICMLATTKLSKVVAELGYMEELYSDKDYDALNNA